MKEEIHWEDIECTFVYELGDSHLDFEVYEIIAHSDNGDGKYSVKEYEKKGAKSSDETTTDLKLAQTLFKGYIKWDACSHVTFGDEEGYIHLCGGSSWHKIIKGTERVYNFAKEKLAKEHSKDMWD